MDQRVLETGTYEPEITQLLPEHLRPGDGYWDAGANAGVHGLSTKQATPGDAAVAFEPSPMQYARLCATTRPRMDSELMSFCIALADKRTYEPFSVVDRGNSGLNTLVPWEEVVYSRTLPCWCDTGNAIVQGNFAFAYVVKVDVEGGEA
jgi:FkbM family methyltransferase